MPRDRLPLARARAFLGERRARRRAATPVVHGGRQTLVGRLVVLLVSGAAVVFVIANAGMWWTSTRFLERNLENQAVKWVAELDDLGTPHYVSAGAKHLIAIDNRIRNFPEIAYVRFYDARGENVIGAYGRNSPGASSGLTPDQIDAVQRSLASDAPFVIERFASGGTCLRVLAPVQVKSISSDGLFNFRIDGGRGESAKTVGYLELGIDTGYYRQELLRSMALGSGAIGVLFLLVLFVGRRLIQRALAPLTNLQVPLARLAGGDTDVEVESGGDAEIAAISEALNVTIRAVKSRDEVLRKLAERDSLTGLLNRASFTQILGLELARVKQSGTESALFFIDLDQFKYVNDTLGHAAGDRLLVQVADLLRARLRENDVIARFGGDEFTVLARDVTRESAIEIAGSINHLLREAVMVEGDRTFNVNCSIGITKVGPEEHTIEELLAQADMACYSAKSRGRNRHQMFEPADEEKLRMTSDIGWLPLIKQAIKEDRFRLLYQPILDVKGPSQEYYEVLLRLRNDDDLVPPSVFLPVAQRFGMLADIDRWVISHALEVLADLRRLGREITFSINLSGQSFEDASLLPFVGEQLAQHGVPGRLVVFEVTEHTAVRYLERAQDTIQGIIDLGSRFALDDFGSGFSSFGYLKRLPVDFIKIDGTFVETMSRDAIDQTMMKSIIQVAAALGKQTIAEFVQDQATVEMLRDFGVDFVQGYYIGPPSERFVVSSMRAVP